MLLIVDYDNTGQDILLADGGSVRRFGSLTGEGFRGLHEVLELMRREGAKRADGVAVVLPDHEAEPERNMSWSTIRAAVALGNALAFAWSVPAVRISAGARSGGGSADEDLRQAASEALAAAGPEDRVSAKYDGEPNITKPKS